MAAPASGDQKKGDLANLRVYKYRFNLALMLLAYAVNSQENVISLMGYGTHENFYGPSLMAHNMIGDTE